MNGGVSLAIWMSGVTREIDRLRQHEGPYGELLDLVHATARVDVIAGASAGGLAGTLLGLAVATESEVSSALNLWIERGGLKAMVRDPFEADPPSLLRGDDYFLSEVNKALGTIAATAGNHPPGGGEVSDAKDHDLHLIITTTTLSGEQKGYPDYFGTVIRDVDHRQAFVFSRTRDPARNDFGTDERSLARLALAARTTSSFPGAFEPSFIPVEKDGRDELHPAMKGVATFDHNRWAVDGGVLVNTPFRRALEAIKTLPAEREVRRVLVYIVASTGSMESTKDDLTEEMPDLRDIIMGSLSEMPRVQSFREELEEITEINQRAAERRRARRSLLLELGSAGLIESADRFLPAYVNTRAEAAIADVGNIVAQELGREASADKPAPTVHRDTLRASVPIPWAKAAPGWTDSPADWMWGIAPIEYGANVVLDLLREALRVPEQPESLRPLLQRLRGELHEQLANLRKVQEEQRDFWRSQAQALAAGTVTDVAAEWQRQAAAVCGRIAFELGRIAGERRCGTARIFERRCRGERDGEARTRARPTWGREPRRGSGPDAPRAARRPAGGGQRARRDRPVGRARAAECQRHQLVRRQRPRGGQAGGPPASSLRRVLQALLARERLVVGPTRWGDEARADRPRPAPSAEARCRARAHRRGCRRSDRRDRDERRERPGTRVPERPLEARAAA